jgi:hypothetical protein
MSKPVKKIVPSKPQPPHPKPIPPKRIDNISIPIHLQK